MRNIIEEYLCFEKAVQTTDRAHQRAKGSRDSCLANLRRAYGCKTSQEAKALEKRLSHKHENNERALKEQLRQFRTKWRRLLDLE